MGEDEDDEKKDEGSDDEDDDEKKNDNFPNPQLAELEEIITKDLAELFSKSEDMQTQEDLDEVLGEIKDVKKKFEEIKKAIAAADDEKEDESDDDEKEDESDDDEKKDDEKEDESDDDEKEDDDD